MKRFQSSFQKIQRIQHQQLRMAELSLARVQANVQQMTEQIRQLEQQRIETEASFIDRLTANNSGLHPSSVRAMRDRLHGCDADINHQAQQREALARTAARLQSEHQALKARCDGVDGILAAKRTEHRQQAMLTEQAELEESSRGIRLLNAHDSNRVEHFDNRSEIEYGVIQ